MLASTLSALLLSASLATALPLNPRQIKLDPAATAEAQQRDNTATRALIATTIKSADGRCLQATSGSGDFRDNLVPIKVVACNNSPEQQWDVITKGKHNDRPGQALIVSTLINGCMNFDPRRAAGNQVVLFSCGGRADGEGQVTDSQLFAFTNGKAALPLVPANGAGKVILTVKGDSLDQVAGDATKPGANDLFTFGAGAGNAAPAPVSPPPVPTAPANAPPTAPVTTKAPAVTTAAPTATGPISVSRAGVVLNPTAAAEANQRDATATRALTGAQIKAADGTCLTIDSLAGDFRQNLIPVESKPCDGSDGQKFDVITAGKHNDQPGNALIVSSLTQGCLNFDPRRAAGDQVILFSCGGRADGEGKVTDSQLFSFVDASKPIPIAPKNGQGNTLFAIVNGKLDAVSGSVTSPAANQQFTFVQ